MANTNDLYEMPRPTLAKVVNIGGVGMESRDAKPLIKIPPLFDAHYLFYDSSPNHCILHFSNLSENVHLFQWLPQSDILQHPKTKAFITHGGYNSVQEAIRGGVPLISIPLFGDQPKNARLAEHHGFGLVLNRAELSVSTLTKAIHEVVQNSK
ncbi:hypothetical protein OSTOST_23881 [Ostertagia ostertagi]